MDNWFMLSNISVAELGKFLEALMLVCFGASWPISIMKTLRVKKVTGKSLIFLCMVFTGYLAGIGKTFAVASAQSEPLSWVVYLYSINAIMVFTDICLYIRYNEPVSAEIKSS